MKKNKTKADQIRRMYLNGKSIEQVKKKFGTKKGHYVEDVLKDLIITE